MTKVWSRLLTTPAWLALADVVVKAVAGCAVTTPLLLGLPAAQAADSDSVRCNCPEVRAEGYGRSACSAKESGNRCTLAAGLQPIRARRGRAGDGHLLTGRLNLMPAEKTGLSARTSQRFASLNERCSHRKGHHHRFQARVLTAMGFRLAMPEPCTGPSRTGTCALRSPRPSIPTRSSEARPSRVCRARQFRRPGACWSRGAPW